MAEEILKRDGNHVTVLGGVTDNVAQEVTMLRVDPVTKRLKVSALGSAGIASINADTTSAQTLVVGTTGSDFNIDDSGAGAHIFNIPDAGASARGLVTTGSQTFNGVKTFGSLPLLPADVPTLSTQAISKGYLDTFSQGLSIRQSCDCATTANITLSGEQTIDGIATSASRVLVKDQSTQANNGIYTSGAGAWTRTTDYDTSAEVSAGTFTAIVAGTINANTLWAQTTQNPTLGVSSLIFTRLAGVVSGIGGSTGVTDNRVLRADGTGGVTLQNSAVTIDDAGALTGVTTVNTFYPAYSGADITVNSASADASTVQAGVALIPSTGATMYINDGTYTPTALSLTRSSTKIILSGGATIQANGASVSPLFTAGSGISRVEVSGGKILQTNATAQGVAFDFSNTPNAWLSRMRIEEFGTGIQVLDTTSTSFYSSFRDIQMFNVNNGISLGGTQPNLNLWENVRIRQKAGGAGTGVNLVDTRGNVFIMVDAEPATAAGITGFHLDGTSRDNLFLGCWIENNATGLLIDSGANNNVFIGGSITSNSTDITDNGTNTVYWGVNKTGTKLYRVPYLSDVNGLEVLKFTETASAVNEFTISNAATGNAPVLSATGNDTNISITLTPKGTGVVNANRITSSVATGNAFVLSGATTGNLIQLTPSGSLGTSTATSGSFLMDMTSATGIAFQIYTNSTGASLTYPQILLHAENSAYNQPLLQITHKGTGGNAVHIRLDGPSPQIEWRETGGSGSAGNGQFETQVQGDIFFINGRNSGDTSFDNSVWFLRPDTTDGMNGNVGIGVNPFGIEKLTIGETTGGAARIAMRGTSAPTADTNYGKLWADSSTFLPKWMSSAGTSYDITLGTATQTLTNKRVTKRVVTTTQSATPTINTDNTDVAYITGLAQAVTSFTSNLSGTPVNGDTLIIDVTDDGTARALTFGASFESSGNVSLPTTTVASTKLTIGFRWNIATSKWTCVGVA